MSSNSSEMTMDLARLEAELLAEEAKAAEQLKKKREALLRAREEAARKAREEAERKAREEQERKAREEQERRARAEEQAQREAKLVETIHWAQEEERELHGKCLLISLEAATNFLVGLDANARPEEDGDYVPDDAMDVEEDAATQGKGKEKEKPLVERFGAARCSTCVNTDSRCQVDLAVVEKWKGDVARGVKVTRGPRARGRLSPLRRRRRRWRWSYHLDRNRLHGWSWKTRTRSRGRTSLGRCWPSRTGWPPW